MNLYAVTLQLFSGKVITAYMAAPNGGAAAIGRRCLVGALHPLRRAALLWRIVTARIPRAH